MIVITAGAKPYLDSFAYTEFDNTISGEYSDMIEKLAVSAEKLPLLSLLFVHIDEYSAVAEKLRSLKKDPFFLYSFVIFNPNEKIPEGLSDLQFISELRSKPLFGSEYRFVVEKSFAVLNALLQTLLKQKESAAVLEDTMQDQHDLINIGRALSIEKNPDKLLSLILYQSKKITSADAGSIYLVEYGEDEEKRLRFKTSETFARNILLTEFVLPLNKNSIAGYVAVTGEVLNIPDVYRVSELNLGLNHDSSWDKKNNYITRSMLVVPMLNHENEVIGVVQLINSKLDLYGGYRGNEAFNIALDSPDAFDRYVVPFDEKYNALLQAVAGQAAVAIENNRLMIQIQTQFDEFVKASVTAIESRDPETSGHSFRVAAVCVAMAKAVNEEKEGYLSQYYFSDTAINELEFAALLHDFGKVYVDLHVFQKKKKLFPKDFEGLMMRLDYLYRSIQLDYSMRETRMIEKLISGGNSSLKSSETMGDVIRSLREDRDALLNRIQDVKAEIGRLNEPSVMEEAPEDIMDNIIAKVNSVPCTYPDGIEMKVITDNDKENLIIRKGSLNREERKEIETHVMHTYNFVKKIPWPDGYKNIPLIALDHHEKINGSGYPKGLKGRESTMLQSRIMAIADIFDALASPDRPYKAAVPMNRIIGILQEEAGNGVLDPDLVRVFIDKQIYKVLDTVKETNV